jgi:hypothetical protein
MYEIATKKLLLQTINQAAQMSPDFARNPINIGIAYQLRKLFSSSCANVTRLCAKTMLPH